MLYAIRKKDGSVLIMKIIDTATTVQEEISKWGQKEQRTIVGYRLIKDEHVPKDRYFRNAWTDDYPTETVDVHMDKARDIHINKLREIRAKKFDELGFPKRIHPSVENSVVDIETKEKLQALRDFTNTLDLSSATTPEELKGLVPDILK